LEYRTVLEELMTTTNLMKLEQKTFRGNTHLAMCLLCLLCDQLFGPQGIQCSPGPLKEAILKHKTRLSAELTRLKVRRRVKSNEELIDPQIRKANELVRSIPRYVRVNLVVTSVDEVISHFVTKDRLRLCEGEQLYGKKSFRRDSHLSDLLVFPNGTNLSQHPLYTTGHIILQDKASCFPAHALSPPPGAICLDACAAPGNKTSHLASLISAKGQIYAFDLDPKRIITLKKQMKRAHCDGCVDAQCGNFLEVDPTKKPYRDVEYLLLVFGEWYCESVGSFS
jgi:putative methyltransferase